MLTARLDFEKLDISLLRHFPNASLELDGLTLVGGAEPFVGIRSSPPTGSRWW